MKFCRLSILVVAAAASNALWSVNGFVIRPAVTTKNVGGISTHLQSTTSSTEDQMINGAPVNGESKINASSGSDVFKVDMNTYNLPLEAAVEEWTANLVTESALQAEGVYLGAKNSKENFVDTERIIGIPRKQGQGLGIELLEIAGGREDGIGITIVSGLVKGGVSEGRGLVPGDSIVKIALHRTGESTDEIASIGTECLGWDATVEAIGNLPPIETPTEYLILTVKRLRRKPKVKVNFRYPPSQGEDDISLELFSGENLRRAMLVRGIKLNDPLSRRFDSGGSGDCGAEGTCATCSVNVSEGLELLNEPGLTEKNMLKKNPRWRLACRAIVGHGMQEGEMTIRVNPRQWDD